MSESPTPEQETTEVELNTTSTETDPASAAAAAAVVAAPMVLDSAAYDATKAALDANAAALQHHQAVVAAAAAHHVAAMQMLTSSSSSNEDGVATNSAGKKMVNHYYIDFSLVTPADVEGDAPLRGEPIGAVLTQGIAAQMGGSTVPPGPNEAHMVSLPIQKKGREIRTFPQKLMEILCRNDITHIISWLPHGRSFLVHNPDKLCSEVLPKFLKPIKFTSFTRQLQLWGFKRITKAPDHGAYYHQLFLRGKGHLLKRMHVTKVKGSGKKLTSNPQQEPDFYSLSRLRPLPDTTQNLSAAAAAFDNSAAMRNAMAVAAGGSGSPTSSAAAAAAARNAAYMQQAGMFLPSHHHAAAFPYMNPLMIPGMASLDPAMAQTQLAQMMLAQQALVHAQSSAHLTGNFAGGMMPIMTKSEEQDQVTNGVEDQAAMDMEAVIDSSTKGVPEMDDEGEVVIKGEPPEEPTADEFLEASEV